MGAAVANAVTNALSLSERYPMLDVSIKDIGSAIGPRTIVDTVSVNPHYGMETLRRESSGLVQNCLLPSFYALAIGSVLQFGIFGKGGMANFWASEKNINILTNAWNSAQGSGEDKVKNYVKNILTPLEGLCGDAAKKEDWKKFATLKEEDFDKVVDNLTKIITTPDLKRKERKLLFEEAFSKLVDHTKAEEIIKFGEEKIYNKDVQGFLDKHGDTKLSSNLRTLMRDMNDMGSRFIKFGAQEGEHASKFASNAIKLLNRKSFIAMPLILAVSFSMQGINRMITKKQSGIDGTPIYKDYTDKRTQKADVKVDKAKLFAEKAFASSLMFLTAWASTGFKGFSKDMFQFKGLTPTMDQCRWISAATFSGRMWASEDKNDLGLSTARDIATFVSFYFLGDYIAKGFAAAFDKNKEMFNITGHAKKHKNPLVNAFRQTKNWVLNYKLKTFAEAGTKRAKNIRAFSQIANLGITTLLLGVGIPMFLNKKTDKNRIEDLKKAGISDEVIKDNYPLSLRGRIQNKAKSVGIYNAFFGSGNSQKYTN